MEKNFFLQPKIRYAYLMYVNTKYLARHPADEEREEPWRNW